MQRMCSLAAKTGMVLLLVMTSLLYSVNVNAAPDSEGEQPTSQPERAVLTVEAAKNGKAAKVSWNLSGIPGVERYKIFRSKKKNTGYEKISECYTWQQIAYLEDFGVDRGNVYYYRLDAITYDGRQIAGEPVTYVCPLEKVDGVRLARYSTSSVKVTWNKVKKAKYYRVYMAKGKHGKYRKIGCTKKLWYRAKGMKNKKDYYFKVQACVRKKTSPADAPLSGRKHIKTRTFTRTTIFAGDSITTGLSIYHTMDEMHIGGKKKVVAAKGLNTITFRTKRVFDGKSGLSRVIAYRPYRVYLMLGINEIHYRSTKEVIAEYEDMVDTIKEECPGTDIVLLACSPVTKEEQVHNPGFGQISGFNQKLKSLAKKKDIKFYDYTGFLKDSEGNLKSQYAAADGYHWNVSAYEKFAQIMEKYDKSLDK